MVYNCMGTWGRHWLHCLALCNNLLWRHGPAPKQGEYAQKLWRALSEISPTLIMGYLYRKLTSGMCATHVPISFMVAMRQSGHPCLRTHRWQEQCWNISKQPSPVGSCIQEIRKISSIHGQRYPVKHARDGDNSATCSSAGVVEVGGTSNVRSRNQHITMVHGTALAICAIWSRREWET